MGVNIVPGKEAWQILRHPYRAVSIKTEFLDSICAQIKMYLSCCHGTPPPHSWSLKTDILLGMVKQGCAPQGARVPLLIIEGQAEHWHFTEDNGDSKGLVGKGQLSPKWQATAELTHLEPGLGQTLVTLMAVYTLGQSEETDGSSLYSKSTFKNIWWWTMSII